NLTNAHLVSKEHLGNHPEKISPCMACTTDRLKGILVPMAREGWTERQQKVTNYGSIRAVYGKVYHIKQYLSCRVCKYAQESVRAQNLRGRCSQENHSQVAGIVYSTISAKCGRHHQNL
ncbi:hypothetical protein ILYODFUR_038430, partial [Ilyodon furcidens]